MPFHPVRSGPDPDPEPDERARAFTSKMLADALGEGMLSPSDTVYANIPSDLPSLGSGRPKISPTSGRMLYDSGRADPSGRTRPTHFYHEIEQRLAPGETVEDLERSIFSRPIESFGADTIPQRNLGGLQEDARSAIEQFQAYAREQGVELTLAEGKRTQERQDLLFRSGRSGTEGEPIRTWTATSNHTPGRGADFVPTDNVRNDNPSWQWIQDNAPRFGLNVLGEGDMGHVELPEIPGAAAKKGPTQEQVEEAQPERLSPAQVQIQDQRREELMGMPEGTSESILSLIRGTPSVSSQLQERRRRTGTTMLGDALVAGGSGPGAMVSSMGSGLAQGAAGTLGFIDKYTVPDLSGGVESLRDTRDRLDARSGEVSEAGFRANPGIAITSRLGSEVLAAAAGGSAMRGAGMGKTAASLFGGAPSAVLQAAGGREGSTVSALTQFMPEDSDARRKIETAMDNPALRAASEFGIDLFGGIAVDAISGGVRAVRSGVGEVTGSGARLRNAAAAAREAEVSRTVAETARSEAASLRNADDLETIEGLVKGGADRVDAESQVDFDVAERRVRETEERLLTERMDAETRADDAKAAKEAAEEAAGDGAGGGGSAKKAADGSDGDRLSQAEIDESRRILDTTIEGQGGGTTGAARPRGTPDPRGRQLQWTKGMDPAVAREVEGIEAQLLESGKLPEKVTETHADLMEAANRLGEDDYAAFLKRNGENLNSVQLAALRIGMTRNAERIPQMMARQQGLMQQLTKSDLTEAKRGDLLDEIDGIEMEMARLESNNDAYVNALSRGMSEAGRTLNSLKAMVRNTRDPFYWEMKMRKIKAARLGIDIRSGSREGDVSILRKREDLPQFTDEEKFRFRDAMARMQDGGPDGHMAMLQFGESITGKTNWWDNLVMTRKAGLLTGPKTMLRNAVSNSVEYLMAETTDRAVATVLDRFAAPLLSKIEPGTLKVKGLEGVGEQPLRSTMWNVKERTSAAKMGASRGVEKAKRVLGPNREEWRTGIEVGSLGDVVGRKWEALENGVMNMDGWSGSAMRWVFDLQGAYDAPFRFAAFWGAIDEQARLYTRHLPENQRAAAIAKYVDEPTSEMVDEAARQSVEAVFANSTKIADLAANLGQFFKRMKASNVTSTKTLGRIGDFVYNVVVPFRRTPSSVVTRAFERSPLGFLNAAFKGNDYRKATGVLADQLADSGTISRRQYAELMRLQKEFVTAGGRAATGTGVMAVGAWLAYNGLATGKMPESSAEREQWQQVGKMPFSVRIGDQWHSLTGVAPFGSLLAYGAQAYQDTFVEDTDPITGAIRAGGSMGQMALEQSFARGILQLTNAVTEGGGYTDALVSGQLGSFVPTLIADLATLSDGKLRETRGDNLGQSAAYGVARRIPGLSQNIPARQNVFGEDIETGASAAFSPTIPRDVPQDLIGREQDRNNLRVPTTRKLPGESGGDFRTRNRAQGRALRGAITELMRSGQWRSLTQEQKQDAVAQVTRSVRRHMNANDQKAKSRWTVDVRRALNGARN